MPDKIPTDKSKFSTGDYECSIFQFCS